MNKESYKTFFKKLSIFTVTVLVLQVFINYKLFYKRQRYIPETVTPLLELKYGENDILFFGDSVIAGNIPNSHDQRKVPNFLQEEDIGNKKVHIIANGGFSANIYKSFLTGLRLKSSSPGIVIFPINIHSNNLSWLLNRNYLFTEMALYLDHLNYALLIQSFYPIIKGLKFIKESNLSKNEIEDFKNKFDSKKSNLGRFSSMYLERFDKENGRYVQYIELFEEAKKSNQKLFFYFSPLDFQYLMQNESNNFVNELELVKVNMKKLFNSYGYEIFDFSTSLNSTEFLWNIEGDAVNEHLNLVGRKHLANLIYQHLNSL